jgi:hypothetical protein
MNNVIKSRFSHQFPNHHQSLHELNNFYNTCVSHVHFISIYYKERRQLKTFLIQFGPTLSLTPDPPVRFVDDQKSETTIKTAIWEAFLPKKLLFSQPARVPAGPTHPFPEKIPSALPTCPHKPPPRCGDSVIQSPWR